MRPFLLDPFFAPLTTLGGVGPKTAPLLDRLFEVETPPCRVVDLLFHLPVGAIDRRLRPRVADAPFDTTITLELTIEAYRPAPPGRARAPFRVLAGDESGDVTLVFFNPRRGQIESTLPIGERRWVSGRIELFDGMRQMVHPERVLTEAQLAAEPAVEPVYPLTEGIGARFLARLARAALARLPPLPEWQDPAFLRGQGSPGFTEALRLLHAPDDMAAFADDSPALARLAYDELLASQLALVLIRARTGQRGGQAMTGDGRFTLAIMQSLPFSLTEAQRKAVADIERDMGEPRRMLRLLQGDVGSGKTVVALLAMVRAVEAGRQAAIMAPTDVLARQHFDRLAPLAAPAGLRLALITGRDTAGQRRQTLDALASGAVDIAVGTHALFQEAVAFRDLGLAVVDEQHKFGVHQRLALGAKGTGVDLLVMTATPIPRTLVLTAFGDMHVSTLREKPAGREPIDTRSVSLERLADVVDAVRRAVTSGAQVYWVCPLVADSETLDVAAAEERYRTLATEIGDRVGLVHGRLPAAEKNAAIERFHRGETAVLVATTVVEVGVDVPNATVMVIEHAERFGLAQLHQLRGRVGRGSGRSTCILLYRPPLGETARARIAIMRETYDGFRIAEEDLRLRGEGDLLGTRQSGTPGFRIARLERHGSLLRAARDDAELILRQDPDLVTARGRALRLLLYLFERDEAVRLLRAG